jgi:hypothetical protein
MESVYFFYSNPVFSQVRKFLYTTMYYAFESLNSHYHKFALYDFVKFWMQSALEGAEEPQPQPEP